MRGGALATAALLVLVVSGCGDSGSAGTTGTAGQGSATSGAGATKVTLGTLPTSNLAPVYLGMQQGFFKDEGLDIATHDVQAGAELITGAMSGDFDFIAAGYVPAITAISQGLPIKIIAANDVGADKPEGDWQVLMVGKDSDVKSVQDLAGKTIATNALKGVGEVAIKSSLAKQGVDPNSIKLTEVPFPEMPAVLDAGRADAAFVPEPFLSQILADGGRQIDAPYPTLGTAFPNGGWETTDKLISSDPELVAKFVRAMDKSVEYAAQHPDEVRKIIPTYTKIPPDVAGKIRLPVFTSELDPAKLDQAAQLAKTYGVIDKVPSADDLLYEPQS
jgi:NitT/TauT family transport system substrate-binding protein